MRRYSLVCDESRARRIQQLATEYNLTEQEVIRQLVDAGLDTVERGWGSERTSESGREDDETEHGQIGSR